MRAFLFLLFALWTINSYSQTRYWVGGSGSWSSTSHWSFTSGGASGASMPLSTQDVIFDANSGSTGYTVTLDVDGECNSFSSTTAANFTFSGVASRLLSVHGSFQTHAGLTHSHIGSTLFKSNNSGNVITIGSGTIASNLVFDGTGDWSFTTNVTSTKDLLHYQGTVLSNGYTLNIGEYTASTAGAKTLDISNSTLMISKNFTASTGLSISATSSQILLSNVNAEIRNCDGLNFNTVSFTNTSITTSHNGAINTSNNCTFGKINFNNNGFVYGNHTIDTLKIKAGKILSLGHSNNQTVGVLDIDGSCTSFTTLKSTLGGSQATIQKASGVINTHQMNLQDISASGGATFNSFNSFDLGNNLGWNIQNGRNLYWIGGTGNWHDDNHWSLTSGGAGGACYPTQFDNVFFDANSFTSSSKNITVQSGFPAKMKNMDWSNVNQNAVLSSSNQNIEVYGSMVLKSTININNFNAYLVMKSNLPVSVTFDGYIFSSNIRFDNALGVWNLQDSLHSNAGIYVENGRVNTLNNNIYGTTIQINNAAIFDISSSIISCTQGISQAAAAFVYHSTGNRINMHSTGTLQLYNTSIDSVFMYNWGTFSGNNNAYGYVQCNAITSRTNFQGTNNSYQKVEALGDAYFSSTTVDTLLLTPSKKYEMYLLNITDSLRCTSTCSQGQIYLSGLSYLTAASIITSENITISTCILQYLRASGTGTFIADNSVDLGGNTNWTFNAVPPRNLYWVGGSGSWSDEIHWSASSGGASGECIPSKYDNVYFDDNSGPTGTTIITLAEISYLKDIHATNTSSHLIIVDLLNYPLNVKGDLYLSSYLNLKSNNSTFLSLSKNAETHSITSNGAVINVNVSIDSSGSIMLIDSFYSTKELAINKGNFNSNGNKIHASTLKLTGSGTNVTIDNSFIEVTSTFQIDNTVVFSNSGTNYAITNNSGLFNGGTGRSFKSIIFYGTGSLSLNNADVEYIEFGKFFTSNLSTCNTGNTSTETAGDTDSRIKKMVCNTSTNINGSGSKFDTLVCAPAKTYQFYPYSVEPDTIGLWIANSTCAQGAINFQSISAGLQCNLFVNTVDTLHNVNFKDIKSLVPNKLFAANSTDFGNNVNITFINSPRNVYWVGGTGNWNDASHWSASSGGIGGECIPTPIDDVFFDVNSFNASGQKMTLDAKSYCRSMSWAGVTNMPKWETSTSSNYTLEIHGSLVLSPNMIHAYDQYLNFRSNTAQTITSGNKTSNFNYSFYGAGPFTIVDTLKTAKKVQAYAGTNVDFSNGVIEITTLESFSGSTVDLSHAHVYLSNTANFTAGTNLITTASEIIFNKGFGYNLFASAENFHHISGHIHANNAFIRLNLNCLGCHVDKLSFNAINATFQNNMTIDSLYLFPGKNYLLNGSTVTLTINDYIDANGDCDVVGVYTELRGPTSGPKAKINSLIPINLEKVMIEGIEALGSNVPFSANNSIDLGNNTGWNFTYDMSRNLYWVGGTGKWADKAHWSLTSGGTGGECPPTNVDNVFFNSASFAGINNIITSSSASVCHDMDWSGSASKTPRLNFEQNFQVFGDITVVNGITLNGSNGFGAVPLILAGSNTNQILCNDYTFPFIHVNGDGVWNVADEFNCQSFNHNNGTFNSNNFNINIPTYLSQVNTGFPILNLFASVWTTSNINISSTTQLINPGTSNIVYPTGGNLNIGNNRNLYDVNFNSTTNSGQINFSSGGNNCTFHKVNFNGNGSINGSHTFDILELSGGKTYTFANNTNTTISQQLKASGSCSTSIILNGSGSGATTAKISKLNGTVNIQNASISNLHGTGGATFNAFNSTGNGNTDGWNIVPGAIATLYWVGDEGTWGDQGHWSYFSGGEGGACLPGSGNDVVFDTLSFSTDHLYVDINTDARCKSMLWSSHKEPSLIGNVVKFLKIYGSLELDSLMNISYLGDVSFEATTTGHTIKSKGSTLPMPIYFNGLGGEWSLLDSMHIDNTIYHTRGSINTNGPKLYAQRWISNSNLSRAIHLSSSLIELTQDANPWDITASNLAFNAGTSTLHFTGDQVSFKPLNNFTYYNIIGNKATSGNQLSIDNATNCNFHSITFQQNGVVNGSHNIAELHVAGGKTLNLAAGSTQTISDVLMLNSAPNDSITIHSSTIGMKAYIDAPASADCYTQLIIKDNEVINGPALRAIKSRDAGNTTNWDFSNPVYYMDADMDGFGDTLTRDTLCYILSGYVTNGSDCDDNDALEFPGQMWHLDIDGDDHGGELIIQCERPNLGFVSAELLSIADCDDNDSLEFPGQTWYMDLDMDGYAYEDSISCLRPDQGFVPSEVLGINDCDDANMNIYPGAIEECDGLDNDCDLSIDLNDQNLRLIVRNSNEQGIGSLYYIINNCPNEDTIHFDASLSGDTIYYQNVHLNFSYPSGVLSRKVINENALPVHLVFDMTALPKAIDITTSVPNVNLLIEHMELSFTNSTSNTAIYLSPTATLALKQMAMKSADAIKVDGGGSLEVMDALEVRE